MMMMIENKMVFWQGLIFCTRIYVSNPSHKNLHLSVRVLSPSPHPTSFPFQHKNFPFLRPFIAISPWRLLIPAAQNTVAVLFLVTFLVYWNYINKLISKKILETLLWGCVVSIVVIWRVNCEWVIALMLFKVWVWYVNYLFMTQVISYLFVLKYLKESISYNVKDRTFVSVQNCHVLLLLFL